MTEQANSLPQGPSPAARAPLQDVLGDLYRGLMHTTQHSVALIGAALAVGLIVLAARADLRHSAEQHLLGWLLQRQEAVAGSDAPAFITEPSAIDRVTATEPHALPKAQANVAFWLSRKYRVAPEPLSALVAEAFEIGQRIGIDPTLILAVMAVESRFNPFAQSPVGAQGLMQVLTRVHTDKYEDFGGQLAAFDPVSNLRVGVRVLQDCIKRAGSIEGGLRLYVGAVSTDGSWYIDKVMAEHARIRSVALGKPAAAPAPTARAIQAVQPAAPAAPAAPQEELEAEVTAPVAAPAGALSRS
jgi:hypothetical protein